MQNKSRVIDGAHKSWIPNFEELFRYKDLFVMLTYRDFKVRYAQTTIGFLWALLQPILTLCILTLVFGNFISVNTPVPHLLFTMSGMAIWTYFSYVITNSGASIISNQAMVKKIYFPRIIIPLSKAAVGFIDLTISLLIMIVLMIYFGTVPSVNVWLAPLFILIGVIAALGVGIWLSALTVRFRDFQHVVPFIVQIGLYVTPVAYPAEYAQQHLPDWAAGIYFLNPMAGVIQGFRWSVFGGEMPGYLMYLSFAMVVLLFFTALIYFNKVEDEMADLV